MASTFFLISLGFVIGLAGWALFLWAVRNGQFDDTEAAKYRMLDDDDDEPLEHRGKKP
jgi:cbb3-type cytochrome oxidase maturation protein